MSAPLAPAVVSPCTGFLAPVCQAAGGVGSGLLGSGAGAVLNALSGWVVEGAAWLLGQVGAAISSSTAIDLGAGWFTSHYRTMVGLAAVVVLPLLLLSVVQAVYRQSATVLVRVAVVQLPLALVLAAAAVELVQLALSATDALSSTISAGAGGEIQQALSEVATTLATQATGGPAPAFVVLLGALTVAFGAFMLWVELLVREAAVYVAVLFLPLALASLVWPAISHWCRRLVDTLVALVLAKFVIVAVLSLAVGALAADTGTGFASVLGGGALLLLAAFTPFTLLRLVPAIEAGAVHQLEGARQRVRQAFGSAPRSAASFALRRARESSFVPGEPGTGRSGGYLAPGGSEGREDGVGEAEAGSGPTGGGSPAAGAGGAAGIKMWRGVAPTVEGTSGSLPTPDREPFTLPDRLGRGPLPLWGGPVPELEDAGGSPPRATREPRDFRRDSMGPVLLGPPPFNRSTDEAGGDGEAADGRGPGGR